MGTIAAQVRRVAPLRARSDAGTQWLVFACLGLLVLVMRGAAFGNPVAEMDEQLYSFIGQRMLHGELPFVDWWDRKPFGLFALYALAHALGGPGPLAYQVPAALATFGGAVLTQRMALRLGGQVGAALAAAFYVVLMSSYGESSGQSEAFHVPLMLVMARLVWDPDHAQARRRALWAMAVGGWALQIKYTVLPQCLFFGGWALWGQLRRGIPVWLALRFALLGIAPTVLVGLFYFAIGGWDAFWFANFQSFFLREGAYAARLYPKLEILLLPLLALLGSGLLSALFVQPPRDRQRYLFCGLWLAAALVTVFLPKTVYAFYLAALVPCIALIATPFFDRRSGPGLVLPLLWLAAMIHLNSLPDRYARAPQDRADITRLAEAIAPHVDAAHACLYVFDGPTALYRLTGSCVPSRIVYPDHLNSALETHALDVSQTGELRRILATDPPVIVTADRPVIRQNPRNQELVRAMLQQHYRPLARMTLQKRQITAWLRDPA